MDARPASAENVVRDFADAWSRLDMEGAIALLRSDIIYHNMPMQPLAGLPQVAAYIRSAGPFDSCCWQILELAVSGSNVLTERIDELVVAGRHIVLPVMGIFAVEDGLIHQWRDYFDLASYQAQWPVAVAA